jgi:hypothetical protein
MASEKEMNLTIKRIVHDSIFPKAPFAANSDFDVDGKIFKVCAKAYKNSGGNKEHFKNYLQKNGSWMVARAALNSKRNGTQDSVCKHYKKCKNKLCFLH